MDQEFSVWLDKDLQIIRQRFSSNLSREPFLRLVDATAACAVRLRGPRRIRILVDVTGMGRPSAQARREMVGALLRPDFAKLAVLGASTFDRILIRFMCVAAGRHIVRTFADEEAALQWLVE